MSLILNIDTATETAYISIAKDGVVLKELFNYEQKNHGGFLQPAIQKILKDIDILINDIDAVAVTEGPGSYTGIRIGMASAKGLCFALNKPLITINTLEVMATSALIQLNPSNEDLLCPMIDARRMEVFTAIYNCSIQNIFHPSAVIVERHSFDSFLNNQNVHFFGSGSKKFQEINKNQHAFFHEIKNISEGLNGLSIKKFNEKTFANTAYSEPLYIKEFYIK
jgi:tRNA threonylcarbamoyladenosine biosynthesis protein TsaB